MSSRVIMRLKQFEAGTFSLKMSKLITYIHGKKKFGNVTPKKRTAKEVSKCRNVSAYLG